MGRIRTFIAVDPGKDIRDRLLGLQDTLARAGIDLAWVEPENIHVTLLFLGEVDDRELAQLCRVVQEVATAHEPFALTVEKVGCFPNERRPRVVWVGVGEGADTLRAIHDELEGPMEDLGYRREERKYTPHLTLGRVKSEAITEGLAKHADWIGGDTVVREILVMSSKLTSQGPIYSVMSRAKLG